MGNLRRRNWTQFNVEKARDLGVKVGNDCRFYSCNVFSEPYLLEIGDNVIISGEVLFVTHDGSIYLMKKELPNIMGFYGKIKIGNNCFIGMRAVILPNVQIGDNCIIGAGAVVTQSFPDNSVIMGNPAKVAFKTEMLEKMRRNSKHTILNDEHNYPAHIPKELKKQILTEMHDIPDPTPARIRRPRKSK